jgi:hypothetical protein
MSAGPHVPDCIPPAPEYASCKSKKNAFATWLIEGAEPLYLIKTDAHTLIYIPSTDMIYSADPQFFLHTSCPSHTVLRGQFILEGEGGGGARILVFDAIRINGEHMMGMDPRERYKKLQACPQWFDGTHTVLQWCGDGSSLLNAIKTKTFQVPHKIRCVAALTSNPMALERLE